MFPDLGGLVRRATNHLPQHLLVTQGDWLGTVAGVVLAVYAAIEQALRTAHPGVVLAVVGLAAFAAARRLLVVLLTVACAYAVGALGLWPHAVETLAMVVTAIALAIPIGIPVGLACAASAPARAVIGPVLDLMRAIPSLAYLVPAAMLFGLGKTPAILAAVIYAAPPLIRRTDLGIRAVDPRVVEASRAFGASRWQILARVRVPLALPSMMRGVNETMLRALAVVVVAALIGAGGVGSVVLDGFERGDPGEALRGGLAIVLLAILFDRISRADGMDPRSRRGDG